MKTITVQPKLVWQEGLALLGQKLNSSHYDQVLEGDVRVLDEEGAPLIVVQRKAIPLPIAVRAAMALERFTSVSDNRGLASDPDAMGFRLRKDGTRSKTRQVLGNVPVNGVAGFFDRAVRFPYCRQTAFTQNEHEAWQQLYPFFTCVSETLRAQVPHKWAAQRRFWEATAPDFRIPESVFTTVTVNKNFATACHQDVGDLKSGFSCLTILRKGKYEGGLFVLPRYRLAVALDSTDVALINPHEPHGNTAIEKLTANTERIAVVFYYRTKMIECGSMLEELERAKNRQTGDALTAIHNEGDAETFLQRKLQQS